MKTVLIFGDSNSHGTAPLSAPGQATRHGHADRWPNVMAAALGPEVEVICEGLPGRTTVHDDPVEGGARNGAMVLPALLHSHKPIDLLVIMLGTNDLKQRFAVSAWEIARSVERLVEISRREGVCAAEMIVAPAPVRETGSLREVFAGAEARQLDLTSYMAASAQRLGCAFVPAWDFVQVSDVDGVHWEADAHHAFGAAMADAVGEALA